jgi:hypothetical protein
MEGIFNNLVDLFLYFDTYAPFERFCIIGGTVIGLSFTYFAVSTAFKIAVKILQFVVSVVMIIVMISLLGFLVWVLFNALILGVAPV